jgi:hypothetical protein
MDRWTDRYNPPRQRKEQGGQRQAQHIPYRAFTGAARG